MIVKQNATIPLELLITDLYGQERTDIDTVFVRVFHRVAGSEVDDLSSTAMEIESGVTSRYYYSWVSTATVGEYIIEYIITDTLAEVYKQYESLTVGYLEDELQFLIDAEGGKWEIISNQMIFYKADGVTEIQRFNLFDSAGDPSTTEVFKRVRV